MRVVAIIQARLGSIRLPRKILMDVCGKPMLQHVIERAQAIQGVDHVALAVPYTDYFEIVGVLGDVVPIHIGPGADVLARYAKVAQETEADVIMRLTGDCPLIAPEVCESVLDLVVSHHCDYATNDTRSSGYPDGLDCQAFRLSLLEIANRQAKSLADREHVCTWIESPECYGEPGMVLTTPRPWTGPKLSVDSQDDLDLVRRIMARVTDYSWLATREAVRGESGTAED